MKTTASLQKLTLIATGTLFCLVYVAYILFAPTKVFCEITAKQAFPLQIFYSRGINFTESQSIVIPIKPTQKKYSFVISYPLLTNLRLDFGTTAGNEIDSSRFSITQYRCLQKEIFDISSAKHINDLKFVEGKIITCGTDPFLLLNLQDTNFSFLAKELISLVVLFIGFAGLFFLISMSIRYQWNSRLINSLSNLQDYIYTHRWFIGYSGLILLVAWGYELFHFTISIDDEFVLFSQGKSSASWLTQGRWGMALIDRILGNPSIPFFSLFVTLSCVICAFLILFELLQASESSKYIFLPLLLACPILYFTFSFSSLCPGAGIAILAATIAAAIFCRSRKGFHFCIGILLGAFAVACYQSALLLMPVVCLAYLLQRITLQNESWPQCIWPAIRFGLLFLASLAGYLAIQKFSLWYFNLQISYIDNFINPPGSMLEAGRHFDLFCLKLHDLYQANFGEPVSGHFLLICLCLALIPITSLFLHRSVMTFLITLFLIFLLAILPFSLDLLNQKAEMPLRSMIAFPFATVCIFHLAWRNLEQQKTLQYILGCFLILIGIQYVILNNKLAYSSKLSFDQDQVLLQNMLSRLYNNPEFSADVAQGKEIPIVVIGYRMGEQETKYPFLKKETVGHSILFWDQGAAHRFVSMLHIMGEKYFVSPQKTDYQAAVNITPEMGTWPEQSSLKYINGIVLIKFSDFSGLQNLRYNLGKKIIHHSSPRDHIEELQPALLKNRNAVWDFSPSAVSNMVEGKLIGENTYQSTGADFQLIFKPVPVNKTEKYIVHLRFSASTSGIAQFFSPDPAIEPDYNCITLDVVAGENEVAFSIPGQLLERGFRIDLLDAANQKCTIHHFAIYKEQP